jgi:hypothetical protein
MNDLEDLLLGIKCDDFITDALMYQKVEWVEYGSLIDNGDGTFTQHYMDKVEPIKVSAKADAHIYRALRDIQKAFNTKL